MIADIGVATGQASGMATGMARRKHRVAGGCGPSRRWATRAAVVLVSLLAVSGCGLDSRDPGEAPGGNAGPPGGGVAAFPAPSSQEPSSQEGSPAGSAPDPSPAEPGPTEPSTTPPGAEPPGNAEAGGEAAGAVGFDLVRWAEGFERPVQVVPVPGGASPRYLVVEQEGTVRLLEPGATGEPGAAAEPGARAEPGAAGEPGAGAAGTPQVPPLRGGRVLLDLRGRIATRGEQGLLSVAFHPRFPEEPWLFASFTDARGDSRILRYPMAPDTLQVDEDGAVVLLEVDQPYANHNGGLILFGPDGHLYVGLGDGGSAGDPLGHGQNPDTLLATLLRLNVDAEDPGRPEIWAMGLRNPWRFSFDRETGDLYIADVGQNAIEEVNLMPAGTSGLNFGWSVWEGSRRFRDDEPLGEATFPIAEYTHDGGHCSITGGYVYRGAAVPALRGVYLFSDLCSGVLWGLRQVDGEWRMEVLTDTDLQPVAFGEDRDGELFLVDHRGAIYRLVAGEKEIPEALR